MNFNKNRCGEFIKVFNQKINKDCTSVYSLAHKHRPNDIIFTGCDSNWTNIADEDCEKYEEKKWCKKDGNHYGSGWDYEKFGTFDNEDWADYEGRIALVCPQCGCGKYM